MRAALVFLFLTSVSSAPLQPAEDGTVTVQIEDGLLRGQVATSIWNITYFSFQNVPFAQPPVGELRFKSPKPVIPWTGVRDALEQGAVCYQDAVYMRYTSANMSEDCLYLNVYVPQAAAAVAPTTGLPVMFWIYGGAFLFGSGIKDFYGPDNLMNRSVILVTINYRVGALGFLSMDHPDVTTNAAFKDQVAALRWVNRNIAQFGGNPALVTIFGESAGGVSVDLLLVSPMTEGLFSRAIAQSGIAVVANSTISNHNVTHDAFLLAQVLGHNATDADDLVKFLRSVSGEDIVRGQYMGSDGGGLVFLPGVEGNKTQEGDEVFLPENPWNVLRAGRVHPVPYIIGFNAQEAQSDIPTITQAQLDSYNNDPQLLIPGSLNLVSGSPESLELAARLKNYFFGNQTISFETMPQLVTVLSDNFMAYSVHRSVNLHALYGPSPLYSYMFSYNGSTLNMQVADYFISAPSHLSDVLYLFYVKTDVPYNPNSADLAVIQHFTSLWTDFALTGNPTVQESVKWTPVTTTNHTYLKIDVNLSLHHHAAYRERMAFWDEVYATYQR